MRFAAGQVAQCKTNSFPFVLGVTTDPFLPALPPACPSYPPHTPHRTQLNSADNGSDRQKAWQKHNMKGTPYAICSKQYTCRCWLAWELAVVGRGGKRKWKWKRKWRTLSSIALKAKAACSLKLGFAAGPMSVLCICDENFNIAKSTHNI